MTHTFFCHYTARDGHTPRRRSQQLTLFNHIINIIPPPVPCDQPRADHPSSHSPTPLWAEVFHRSINGQSYQQYLLHAQLSDTVAVYIEHIESNRTVDIYNEYLRNAIHSPTLCHYCSQQLDLLRQYLDLTTYLINHPDSITPPILNAYKEARPSEYELLKPLCKYEL